MKAMRSIEIFTTGKTMSDELSDVEKSLLLNRAMRNAIDNFQRHDDWGIEASVRAAIDDAADDRDYVAGYDGPRSKVCDFLSQYRVEIGNAVLDEVMDDASQEEKRKAAGMLKSRKCDHKGHRYLDDDEKIRCEDCDEVLGIPSEQWDAEMKYDETIEADPCPVCGAEFFNVKVSYGGQFVKRSGEIVEDRQAVHLLDDAWDFQIERATCGNCDAPLVE